MDNNKKKLPSELRHKLRKRAWQLAEQAYTQYVSNMETDYRVGRVSESEISEWAPPAPRGGK